MSEKSIFFLICLLILMVTNIFGLFNILESLRIAGIGKPNDFILLILIIITLTRTRYLISTIELKKLFRSNLYIIIYTIFLILLTVFVKKIENFNFSLRVASHYFYYISLIFPIFLINHEKFFIHHINFLRLGGIITSLLIILSNILGYNLGSGYLSGEEGKFIRVYIPSFFNYFVIIFWILIKISKARINLNIGILEVLINFLGILFFLGRGRIIVLLAMIFFILILFTKGLINKIKLILTICLTFVLSIYLLQFLDFPVNHLLYRLIEGFEQLKDPNMALTGRLYAITLGFEVFIKTPIFGTGFVHPTSNYFQTYLVSPTGIALTNSADFGLISILYTTGIIGFILIINFIVKLLNTMYSNIRLFIKTNIVDTRVLYSMTLIILILFVFFGEQIVSNDFAQRMVCVYLISAGYAIKFRPLLKNTKS